MPSLNTKQGFLPNFCAIRMVFAWVITVELLAVILTLAAYPRDFWQELSLSSLYLQWIGLSLNALLCLLRKSLNKLQHAKAGAVVWLLIMAVTIVAFFIAHWLLQPDVDVDLMALIYQLSIAAIIGAIVLRYLYEMHCLRERELAEVRARVQALQARIRPHFLFNSMNTIASLTRVDAKLAEQVVEDLSDLFRASLSDSQQASTLEKEISLAKGYLRIEQQRLGDRLKIKWDMETLPSQAHMPALLLQPLLENAVYHGIEPSISGGTILISGRFRRGIINISISNPVADNSKSSRQGNQMAQANVRERLQANYGESANMRIGTVDDQYQVRIFFPDQLPEQTL